MAYSMLGRFLRRALISTIHRVDYARCMKRVRRVNHAQAMPSLRQRGSQPGAV